MYYYYMSLLKCVLIYYQYIECLNTYILKDFHSASCVSCAPNSLNPPRSIRSLDQNSEEPDHHHHHLEGICPDHSLQSTLNTHTLALFLLFLSDHQPLSPSECPIHKTLNRFKYTVIFQRSNISQVSSNSSCFLMKQIIIFRYDADILTDCRNWYFWLSIHLILFII